MIVRIHSFLPRLPGVLALLMSVAAHGDRVDGSPVHDSINRLSFQADSAYFTDSTLAMSNRALQDYAESLRSNTISMTQRHLNYQWLLSHHNPEAFAPVTGGRVLGEIFKMSWHAYRQQHQHNKRHFLFRYNYGQGRLGSALSYDLRLTDDAFKLSFRYAL